MKRIVGGTIVAVTLVVTVIAIVSLFNPFCYIFSKDSIEWIAFGCGLT